MRAWVQVLDIQDGSYIVRFRLYQSYPDIIINVKYKDEHVAKSPYTLSGIFLIYNFYRLMSTGLKRKYR